MKNYQIEILMNGACVEWETITAATIEEAKGKLINLIRLEWVQDGRKMEVKISEK